MIEVIRDGYGIPHCYAADEYDAFFSQGWVHAEDRLWQMEYDRRRGTGRWAEISGRRGVPVDVFFRHLDLPAAVQRDLAALTVETHTILGAYSAGVNASIATGRRSREFAVAGIDPEPWEPWHSLLVARVRHVLMGSARSKLWRAVVAASVGEDVAHTMVAGLGEEHVACVPPGATCTNVGGLGDPAGGSNNWVLAGTRTASGLPLLAGDPHRELDVPNVYVQGHIACPDWDVLGIGIPGIPGFSHFGHNDRVAWSITHAMADDQDLYEVTSANTVAARTETIRVRDGDDVTVDVVHTDRGPVIGEGLAMTWTATAEVNTGFDVLGPMLRARSVAELFDAMRDWVEPVNSLLAADTDGHIGYLTRGRIPVRERHDAVWLPVRGDDPALVWKGWVPFEQLPRCVDPPGGFLFSANNPIAADPAAPYIGIDTATPWRATRVRDIVADMYGATREDMEALHRDVVSLAARRWLGRLRDWPPLDGWDGGMDATSTAAAAYSMFRRELMHVVLERSGLESHLADSRNRLLPGVVPETVLWRVIDQHVHTSDPSLLAGWSWAAAIDEATHRAEKAWSGETWGELHGTVHRHPLGPDLDPPAVPMGGDLDTVMAASYIPTSGLAMRAGAVTRYAFDLADWDNSGWVVPLGAAGEPGAPHAYDQQDAWRGGRLLPALYTRAAVEASATERSVLGTSHG